MWLSNYIVLFEDLKRNWTWRMQYLLAIIVVIYAKSIKVQDWSNIHNI